MCWKHTLHGSCRGRCGKSHVDPGVNKLLSADPLPDPKCAKQATSWNGMHPDVVHASGLHIAINVVGNMYGGLDSRLDQDGAIFVGNGAQLEGSELDLRDPDNKEGKGKGKGKGGRFRSSSPSHPDFTQVTVRCGLCGGTDHVDAQCIPCHTCQVQIGSPTHPTAECPFAGNRITDLVTEDSRHAALTGYRRGFEVDLRTAHAVNHRCHGCTGGTMLMFFTNCLPREMRKHPANAGLLTK